MNNKVKLSQEELQSLKSLQEKQNQLVVKFGQLEYEIQNLELQNASIYNYRHFCNFLSCGQHKVLF